MLAFFSSIAVEAPRSSDRSISGLLRSRVHILRITALALSACCTAGSGFGQTAHFSGAEIQIAGGGSNTLGIAVDRNGDLFYTSQSSPGQGSWLSAILPGSNTTYTLSGFTSPTGLALDSSGNLYVLDAGNGTISKIAAFNGSIPVTSPSITTVATGITTNGDLAADSHGNIFFTTGTGNTVNEILAVNGVIPPSPVIRTLGTGFNFPVGIVVDSLGDVYVADAMNNAVKELVAVNGSVPDSPTIVTIGSGFNLPAALALDDNGDLFVSDFSNNALKELVAVNGALPANPAIRIVGSFTQTEALTRDPAGNFYVGSVSGDMGSVSEVSLNGANFPSTAVGSQSFPIAMPFTFDSAGTLGGIAVLTQGTPGLDYSDDGSGTCKANTSYAAGQTCTVNAIFSPRYAGTRYGAVVLKDATGNPIAAGFLQGTGMGPQVNFAPGAESTVVASGLSAPTAVAVDGGGNLYIADNNSLIEATPSAGGYTLSTITSDISVPWGVAVDGAGNVYVGDNARNRVLKEVPAPSGYIESTLASGFTPAGIAIDGSGNVFIVDQFGGSIVEESLINGGISARTVVTGLSNPLGIAAGANGDLYIADSSQNGIVKETLASDSFVQSMIPVAGQVSPQSVAVDGVGNVYFEDSLSNNIFKETPTSSGYVESTVVSDLQLPPGPAGITVDASGNLYIAYLGAKSVVKADFADAPVLNFATTPFGTTSPDSPRTVTLMNGGNAPLTLPVPSSGNNPAIGPNFTLDSSSPADCPLVSSSSSAAGTLAPEASCQLTISFTPTAAGAVSGTLVITDDNMNVSWPSYASQTIVLNGTAQTPATLTWPTPAPISYGTALSAVQLDATANVPGTFSYSPAAGTVLSAGSQTLTVTFTPSDTADYSTTTQSVVLMINPAAPSISWATPSLIGYGTPLSASQLDATSNVPGTFSYSPAAGTVLGAGTHTLTVTFTPTDTTDYATASQSVLLTVNKASPVISWPAPAPITYGAALSSTQLDASANVPGTFVYNPAAGTVPAVGNDTLTTTFTPSDTADYTTATASVVLTVNPAPGFSLSLSPATVSVALRGSAKTTVAAVPAGGFTGSVSLSVTGLPSGVTASFSPNPATTSSVLTLTATQQAPIGRFTVSVQGTSGSLRSSAELSLTVSRK